MSRKIPENEIQDILSIIAAHPDGISISGIAEELSEDIPHRTLQRRLRQLVNEEQLQITGKGRGTKYRPVKTDVPKEVDPKQQKEASNEFIVFSNEGRKVQGCVRQEVSVRRPVGYNRDFLDRYQPNTTFYLEEQERKHLKEIGELPAAGDTYARHTLNRFLLDLAWNSSRLEGNTYSLIDTRKLIELGMKAAGQDHAETQMILNHKDAIEFLTVNTDKIGFNRYFILNLHTLLSNNLLKDRRASGRLRSIAVQIGKSAFYPLDIPQLIEECFAQILSKAARIEDAFEQALFVLVHIPYLQPFEDVNKRVSRLAANIPLVRNNLAPLSFMNVRRKTYVEALLGVYELNDVSLLRDVFLGAYTWSSEKYISLQQKLEKPEFFRLKYQPELRELIAKLIREKAGVAQVSTRIAQWTEDRIRLDDQSAFAEIVEEDLIGMHEGNFAPYKVQLSEYEAWKNNWDAE